MSIKKIIVAGIVVVVVSGSVAFAWHQGYIGDRDRRLLDQIKNQPNLVSLYTKAKATQKRIAKEPNNVTLYLDEGLFWKSIGEQGGGRDFFARSLVAYEAGIDKFGQKNILFYLNAGKVAERVEDYTKAERYYKKSMELSPGDEVAYIDLIDLYSLKLNQPKEVILKVFDFGLEKMVNKMPLTYYRGSYLRRIGDYAGALKDYQTLVEAFPDKRNYKDIVAELKAKIIEEQGKK